MAANNGVRAYDGVVLNGRAAQNRGSPADEHVITDGHGLLVAEDIAGQTLDYRPRVVVREDGDRTRQIDVVADGEKVRSSDIHVSNAWAVERDVLADLDPFAAQVTHVTVRLHKQAVVQASYGLFFGHSCASFLSGLLQTL